MKIISGTARIKHKEGTTGEGSEGWLGRDILSILDRGLGGVLPLPRVKI